MSLLSNFTIKARLQINAVVIAIALTVLFILMVSNANKMSDLGQTLANVERLKSQVLMLRRHEKDFLARKDIKYLGRFNDSAKELQANVSDLNQSLDALGIGASQLQQFATISRSYESKFAQLAAFQQTIGLHPKDGLYGDLREAVHQVEELLAQNDSQRLLADMLQLRRAEKDFMLRRDTKYLEKFDSNMAKFNQDLSDEALDSNLKSQISDKLAIYRTKFEGLVKAETEIGLDTESGLLGELRSTIHQTETTLKAMTKTLQLELDSAISAATISAVVVFVIAIGAVMVVVYFTSLSIINPILAVRNAIAHIRTKNDLTWLVRSKGKDELSQLAKDVNSLVSDFKGLIFNVKKALSTLDNATEELAVNSKETLEGMERQFEESDMVATSGAEMQATVSDINANTQLATKTANQTGDLAVDGAEEVKLTADNISKLASQLQEALTQIEKLEADSQSIGTVSEAIRGIAEQTNLLALNAAIEAARAGEQGRGFAVVADEVRSLAMRTQESTSEIENIINSLQASTQSIVSLVNECYKNGKECSEQASSAGEALQLISSHVMEVVDMNCQISNSLQEQDTVAKEMSKHVIQIRDIAEQSQMRAATNAEASQDIAEQATILHKEVERYKVERND